MTKRRCLTLILWLACVTFWIDGHTLSLTDIDVKSQLNQPLLAHIGIIDASQQEIDNLQVNLGSVTEFKRRGLYFSSLIKDIRFKIVEDEISGKAYILLTSQASITTPVLKFLIELNTTGQGILQEYTLLLDPAAYGKADTPAHKAPIAASAYTIEYELDPYYSNVGVFVSLTDAPMRNVNLDDEGSIYRDLLKDAFTPSFFLFELSVNPLPLLGTYLKEEQRDFYDKGDVDDELNLIQALTEGFEEPYALSFFLGNVIRFASPQDTDYLTVNKGFSGFLLSIGDQHIKDAELFDDDWYEVEWKIKGDRRIGSIYHSWSFRVGIKIHSNSDIADVNYIGIRREFFNDKLGRYRWNENIGIDFSLYFSRDDGKMVQQQLFVEKKWPAESGEYTLGIGINRNLDRYTGELADPNDDLKLIVRPGYSF